MSLTRVYVCVSVRACVGVFVFMYMHMHTRWFNASVREYGM